MTGWYGGWVDEVLMRLNDALASFPSILILLVLVSLLGGGREHMTLALGIVFIPSYARIVRSEFARARTQNYVHSAELMGASTARILFVHILPNIWHTLVSAITIGFNNAVLAEAAMSYLSRSSAHVRWAFRATRRASAICSRSRRVCSTPRRGTRSARARSLCC